MIRILILSIFSAVTLANYPYFFFDKKSLKLHRDSYYRYIRPQLKNIKSEFYHISRKVSPIHNTLIPLREKSLALKTEYNKLYKECIAQQKEQLFCELNLATLLRNSYQLDSAIMKARLYAIQSNDISANNYASYIHFTKNLDEVEIINTKIQRFLELRKIVDKTLYTTYTRSFTDLSNSLNKLFTLVNFAYVDMLPIEQRRHYEAFLVHFLVPIEDKMISNFSPQWFKDSLGQLNLTWNTFHMNLEKGQTNFPRNLIKIVKIMHNRWNSILKIMF